MFIVWTFLSNTFILLISRLFGLNISCVFSSCTSFFGNSWVIFLPDSYIHLSSVFLSVICVLLYKLKETLKLYVSFCLTVVKCVELKDFGMSKNCGVRPLDSSLSGEVRHTHLPGEEGHRQIVDQRGCKFTWFTRVI